MSGRLIDAEMFLTELQRLKTHFFNCELPGSAVPMTLCGQLITRIKEGEFDAQSPTPKVGTIGHVSHEGASLTPMLARVIGGSQSPTPGQDGLMPVAQALDLGIKWMQNWLDEQCCECENGHWCGRNVRLRELEQMKQARALLPPSPTQPEKENES